MTSPHIPNIPYIAPGIGAGAAAAGAATSGLPSPRFGSSQQERAKQYGSATDTNNGIESTIEVQGKKGTPEYNDGSTLLGTLSLPDGLTPTSVFAWSIDAPVTRYANSGNGRGPDGLNTSVSRQTQTLTEMTVAGSMSWLRNLAVQAPEQYNEIVMQLVGAQYLTYDKARFGSYTTAVGDAFLKSVADVWSINQDEGVGQLTTWGDHMKALIDAAQAAGQTDANGLSAGGSGGGVRQAPTRIDQWTDPDTIKAAGNAASKNVLGRDLNDSEMKQFSSVFHAAEQTWNDQQWAAQQQSFAGGGSAAITDRPSPQADALNYIKTDPGLQGERTEQSIGSYIGVLRQMTGLGSGGISDAIS